MKKIIIGTAMKKLIIGTVFISSLLMSYLFIGNDAEAYQNYRGCYVCSDNTFIKYSGNDSLKKRERAKKAFKCNVVKSVKSCDSEDIVE